MIRDAASFAMGYRIGLALKEHTIIAQEEEGPWLTFSSPEPFTLGVYNAAKNWDGTLEYSTDTTTWIVWDGTTTLASGAGNKLYLRGSGNTSLNTLSSSRASARFVLTGSNVCCDGNIETLLDYETVLSGNDCIIASSAFRFLFYQSTPLVRGPVMPKSPLANYCCASIFYGCTNLQETPLFPAIQLAAGCYQYALQYCVSLSEAPLLPASQLKNYCYDGMLDGCAKIKKPPILPAKDIANYSYRNMMANCYNIEINDSDAQEYDYLYRIPDGGEDGIEGTGSLTNMFRNTSGTISVPEVNNVYKGKIKTDNNYCFTIAATRFLTLYINGTNISINWADGNVEPLADYNSKIPSMLGPEGRINHTYSTAESRKIVISGNLQYITWTTFS